LHPGLRQPGRCHRALPIKTTLGRNRHRGEQTSSYPPFEFSTDLPEVTATPALAEVALSFGGEGTGSGKFQDARSIAIDGEGNIYVARL
jgi:hypothetical protein